MKSVGCEMCCFCFHHSLGDSLPTAGKWKEDFSAKGGVFFLNQCIERLWEKLTRTP